jgi:uncharacterized protein YggT (Ycf19 family)
MTLANFYLFLMFVMAILGLLGAVGMINLFNDSIISKMYFFLISIIQPPLQFIGRFVPRIGMLDLPFLVLLVGLWIVVDLCKYYIAIISANSFGF